MDLSFDRYYSRFDQHSIDELCCSADNKFIPFYAVNHPLLKSGGNIFYSKVTSNYYNIRSVRGVYTHMELQVPTRFKYPEISFFYYTGKHVLYTFTDGKVEVLMMLAVRSESLKILKRYDNIPQDFVLLVDVNFAKDSTHKKMAAYMNRNYILDAMLRSIDVIYTSKIDEYCFQPYSFKINISTLEQLNAVNHRIRYDLRGVPVIPPVVEIEEELPEEVPERDEPEELTEIIDTSIVQIENAAEYRPLTVEQFETFINEAIPTQPAPLGADTEIRTVLDQQTNQTITAIEAEFNEFLIEEA